MERCIHTKSYERGSYGLPGYSDTLLSWMKELNGAQPVPK